MNVCICGSAKNYEYLVNKNLLEDLSFLQFEFYDYNELSSNQILVQAQYLVLLIDEEFVNHHYFYYLLGCWNERASSLTVYFASRNKKSLDELYTQDFASLFGEAVSNYKILKMKLKSAYNVFLIEEKKRKAKRRLMDAQLSLHLPELIDSIQKGEFSHVKDFIEIGFSPSAMNKKGVSLVALSIRSRNPDIFNFLVERGADLHVISEDRGYNLLLEAVVADDLKILKMLLEFNIDVNILSKNNQTALILAAGQNSFEVCQLLLEHGADKEISDNLGMTALDYANVFKYQPLIDLLEKK